MKHFFYTLPKVALPQVAPAAARPSLMGLIVSAVIAVGLAAIGCTSIGWASLRGDAESGAEISGVYEGGDGAYGAAWGYRGMIRVRVRLDGGTITELSVVESREDWNVGEAAIEELTDLVLMYNTTELDAVSGATETSRGFLQAVERAIMGP